MGAPSFTPARLARRERLQSARVYLLATQAVARRDLVSAVAAALDGGVDVVQLREKTLPHAAFVELAVRLRDLCRTRGALFIVNDRVEIAGEVAADGIHLGQEDSCLRDARETLGPDAVIGVSTHDERELEEALQGGADYVGVGSLYPTATKSRFVPVGDPVSLAPLAARAEAAGVPAFAIGGIDPVRATAVAAAGFRRIAASAGLLAVEDPRAAAGAMRAALDLTPLTPR